MLRASRKGETDGAVDLAPEEDCLLRDAFGRYGGSARARTAAAPVVARYQQLGAGRWFLCDCRPGAERPPALVPVSQTHIRRHQDERWPVHSEDCVLFRDSAEQRIILDSHMRAAAARPMRLARHFDVAASALNGRIEAHSHTTKRPGLARLLLSLAEAAGFQIISAGWRPAPLVDQVKALWQAARAIELDADCRCRTSCARMRLASRSWPRRSPRRSHTGSRATGRTAC